MIGVAMKDKAPYNQVLTHGFTVDGQGRKMSKSIGNVVSPQDVMNKLGADILRLWVASTDYTGEMTVSDEILKRSADAYRRIRNTARFLLGQPERLQSGDRHGGACRHGRGGSLGRGPCQSGTSRDRDRVR
jgi:isoleucyl-tRNA synthetase